MDDDSKERRDARHEKFVLLKTPHAQGILPARGTRKRRRRKQQSRKRRRRKNRSRPISKHKKRSKKKSKK